MIRSCEPSLIRSLVLEIDAYKFHNPAFGCLNTQGWIFEYFSQVWRFIGTQRATTPYFRDHCFESINHYDILMSCVTHFTMLQCFDTSFTQEIRFGGCLIYWICTTDQQEGRRVRIFIAEIWMPLLIPNVGFIQMHVTLVHTIRYSITAVNGIGHTANQK